MAVNYSKVEICGIDTAKLPVISEKEKLELYYLPSGYDLVPGDNILTSGIGGIFPKGIAIGTVTEVSRANEDTEDRNAIIEPAVDFLRLEEGMIVNMEEQEEE